MKWFAWDPEKDEVLKESRGISFEEVVLQVERGGLLDILDHHDQQRYPGQRIFVVEMGGYDYLVPFVESETEIFQKTVFPSRKATSIYLTERPDGDA